MQGLFSQSAYILVYKAPTLDELAEVLGDFTLVGRTEAPPDGHWALGGASLVFDHPEGPGRVLVDVVDRKWPDDMGDPVQDPVLFAAWSAGGFGPAVFPGNLERAGKQAWVWRQASGAVRSHQAFVRLRSTFGEDGPPEGHDPKAELLFLTRLGAAVLSLQTSLAWFDPSGEAMRPREFVDQALAYHAAEGVPPLDVWTNVRIGRLTDDWILMDTVGLGQLGLPDIEACFKSERYTFEEVDTFLRQVAEYVADAGDVLSTGDAVPGPKDVTWEVLRAEQGLNAPPRATVRLLPEDGSERTRQVLDARPMAAVIEAAQAEFARQQQAETQVAAALKADDGEG
ncbi:MAG: DUF4261 domain-containing protein [Myxococcales bacterium]|nr:DUF4261 domain-containing protein [Myxococcales bacterium]